MQVFYGGHITDGMDRRCCTTYLEVLIRPEILPKGDLADPSTWQQVRSLRARRWRGGEGACMHG